MYLLKSSHNLGNTDERAQGYELRSPAGEETRAEIYLQASSLLSPLELAGPPSKLQLLAGILCIYHPYWGLVPVPSLLLEVPECLGRLTLSLCSSNPTHTVKNLVQFSRPVVSDSLRPHGLHHARPPCPSSTPGVYSNSCPMSR